MGSKTLGISIHRQWNLVLVLDRGRTALSSYRKPVRLEHDDAQSSPGSIFLQKRKNPLARATWSVPGTRYKRLLFHSCLPPHKIFAKRDYDQKHETNDPQYHVPAWAQPSQWIREVESTHWATAAAPGDVCGQNLYLIRTCVHSWPIIPPKHYSNITHHAEVHITRLGSR